MGRWGSGLTHVMVDKGRYGGAYSGGLRWSYDVDCGCHIMRGGYVRNQLVCGHHQGPPDVAHTE